MVESMPVGLTVGDRSQGYEVTGKGSVRGLESAYIGKDTRDRDAAVSLLWLSEDQDQSALFGLTRPYEDIGEASLVAPRTLVRFGGGSAMVIGKEQGAPLTGETLDIWLEGRPAVPLGRALNLLHPVFLAVQALHERGLAHGQLSPQHIVIDNNGTLRLLPPALLHGAEAEAALAATRAPELVSGSTSADPVSDVFSLSMLLRWMVAGQKPESADARMASKAQRDNDPLAPVTNLAGSLPSTVSDLLDSALKLHPATRPQSVAALLDVLDEHRSAGGNPSASASPPPQSGEATAPNPWSGSVGSPPPLPGKQTASRTKSSVPPLRKRAQTIGEAPPPLPTSSQSTEKPKRKMGVLTIMSFVIALAVAWFVASGGLGTDEQSVTAPDRSNETVTVDEPRKGPRPASTDTGAEGSTPTTTTNDSAPADGVLEQVCNSRFTFENARDSGTNALRAYLQQCQSVQSDYVEQARDLLGLN